MLATIIVLSAICGLVQCSGIGLAAPAGAAPVVTAASSQYFERTFNRLVAAPQPLQPVVPVVPPTPILHVARAPAFIPVAPPPPVLPVTPVPPVIRFAPPAIPLLPARPVFVPPTTKNKDEPAPTNSPQNPALDPNVAIAVATANAAAPVATILLPPYPFGPPPSFGFIPSPSFNVPEQKPDIESTTQTTTRIEPTTTEQENEATTPVPSNIDNSFVQALPSNENVNFREYYAPPVQLPVERPPPVPRPLFPAVPPQKVKTSVEVVPVPLTYIAPPPLHTYLDKHHHHHPLKLVKVTKHIHTFVPSGKIIIRPVLPYKIRSVKGPPGVVMYKKPLSAKYKSVRYSQKVLEARRSKPRDTEPITLPPFARPNYKPPRL